MIFIAKPENFKPLFEVVSCFVEQNSKFLLLRRQAHKPQGGTWGAPAGKVSLEETKEDAMARELWEETGYKTPKEALIYTNTLFVRYDLYDFTYHTYSLPTKELEIKFNPEEHAEYRWVTPQEALTLPLIEDMDYCVKLFYKL
jgi:8-oxo-dGTP diphosphatase